LRNRSITTESLKEEEEEEADFIDILRDFNPLHVLFLECFYNIQFNIILPGFFYANGGNGAREV